MQEVIDAPAATQVLSQQPAMPLALQQQSALQLTTPEQVLAVAATSGANLEQMERLMALAERMTVLRVDAEKRTSEKAFNEAFAAFRSRAIRIIKSKTVADGPLKNTKHATLADVIDASTSALAEHGLSTAFKLTRDEPDWLEVTCTLKHVCGHYETVSMGGAPDKGPGRNAIQARASTKTYLERYTLTAILGLAAREQDDDGNGGPKDTDGPPLGDVWAWKAQKAETPEALQALWEAGLAVINKQGERTDYTRFKAAVAARKAELEKAAQPKEGGQS